MNDKQLAEIVSIFGETNVFLMDEKMIISPVPKSIFGQMQVATFAKYDRSK